MNNGRGHNALTARLAEMAFKDKQLTSTERRKLSDLAARICRRLLFSDTYSEVVCPDSGLKVEGGINAKKMKSINVFALGPFYRAYNHYYVLCQNPQNVVDHEVRIVEAKTRRTIGTVTPNSVQLQEAYC